MNQLIKVEVNNNLEQVVSARDLHTGLGIGKDFTSWFKQQAERLDLLEGTDFTPFWGESIGGRPSVDYTVTVDIAKHICLVSGGDKAHQFRTYFIEVEKAWNSPEQTMARALKFAHARLYGLEEEMERQRHKVEFFDQVASSKDAIQIGDAAKVLNMGMGRNSLFEFLRQRGVLMRDNIPYQEFIDRGYFRVIEQKYTTPKGETKISIKTLVYQRGLEYIRKALTDKAAGNSMLEAAAGGK